MKEVNHGTYFWQNELVHLRAFSSNAEKTGCIEEGRRRQMVYINGKYRDEILFGITIAEFEAKHTEVAVL